MVLGCLGGSWCFLVVLCDSLWFFAVNWRILVVLGGFGGSL